MGSGEEFLPAKGGWQNFSPGKITIRRRRMAKFPLREEFPCPNSSQGKHFPTPREFDPLYGDGKVETSLNRHWYTRNYHLGKIISSQGRVSLP